MTDAVVVIANGTVNVTIQCNNCMNDDRTLNNIRWYDPDENRVPSPANIREYVPDAPHFTRVDGAENDIILVIPTFSEAHVGTYTCGDRNGPSGPPTAYVNLTTGGRYSVLLG